MPDFHTLRRYHGYATAASRDLALAVVIVVIIIIGFAAARG